MYLSFFQKFLLRPKKIIAKLCDPESFKCKPFRLKCLLMTFLLCKYLIVADGRLIDLQLALPSHYVNAVLVSKYIFYNQLTSPV